MNELRDLAYLSQCVVSANDTIASKSSRPTPEDWQLGLGDDEIERDGWPLWLRQTRNTLRLFRAAMDAAKNSLGNATEIRPNEQVADQWKPRCYRILLRLASIEGDDAVAFVNRGRLPSDWQTLSVELDDLADEYEAVALAKIEADADNRDETNPYVMANTIWKGRFETYPKFAQWLAKHPEIPNEQRGQRRYVHAAKCLEVLAKQDQAAFDGLDETERPEVVPNTVDNAIYLDNVCKLYREVNARKNTQK